MAELTTKARKAIPSSDFGMPGQRKYPMPDRSHAANAKARAKQMLDKGRLTQGAYDRVVSKANRMLGAHGSVEPDDGEAS